MDLQVVRKPPCGKELWVYRSFGSRFRGFGVYRNAGFPAFWGQKFGV